MPFNHDDLEIIQDVFLNIRKTVGNHDRNDRNGREIFRRFADIPGGGIDAMGEPRVYSLTRDQLSKWDDPYDAVYGVDGGTTRPEAYNTDVVIDVAKARAAMLGNGNEDVEEKLTVVAGIYSPEDDIPAQILHDDEAYSEILPVQRGDSTSRITSEVTTRAQKTAEGHHAKRISGLDGPLFIDGSIYPRTLMTTLYFAKKIAVGSQDAKLTQSAGKAQEQEIVDNYVNAIDNQMDENQPVIGIVKTMQTDELVSSIERKMQTKIDNPSVPWPQDSQFMSDVLYTDDPEAITFTSWLVETKLERQGRTIEPMQGFDIDENRTPEDYRRSFFYVRVPRKNIVFRVEAPLMMADPEENEEMSRWIQRKAVKEIAQTTAPPMVIQRADNRANISKENAKYLKKLLADNSDRGKNLSMTKDYNKHERHENQRYGDSQ